MPSTIVQALSNFDDGNTGSDLSNVLGTGKERGCGLADKVL